MIPTVPVIFHGGAYGTYVEWCLTTLCSDQPIQAPFTVLGNSHGFQGHHVARTCEEWTNYVESNKHYPFVRTEPKIYETQSAVEFLNLVMSSVDRAVLLYPDPHSIVLNLNNVYYKTFADFWKYYFESDPDGASYVLQNWPVPPGTHINDVAVWIKREWLSLWFVPWWLDILEWYLPDRWQSDRCCVVLLQDLLHNFEPTLQRVVDFLALDTCRSVQELISYHEQNLQLQKHIDQDQICNAVVDCTLNSQYYEWTPLSLPSEAWVQWRLRTLGWEIRCDGLDILPTNSVHLKELIYPL